MNEPKDIRIGLGEDPTLASPGNAPNEAPRQIGRYEIRGMLGKGGMGEVYRAYDSELRREVALKVLPSGSTTEGRWARLRREAQALAALKHSGVVTVHSVESVEGASFLTMELLEGQTLAEHIASGLKDIDETIAWSYQLVDALAAAHQAGIIHRDLKPSNIMVSPSGALSLVDFGLVKHVRDLPSREASDDVTTYEIAEHRADRTVPGSLIGTVAYMSPEQARGEEVDEHSDVFSLGVVLYELFTGISPHRRNSLAESAAAVLNDSHRPVTQLRKDVPAWIQSILEKCLRKEASERFASAVELREAMSEHIDAERVRAGRRSLPMWMPIALGLLVLVLGFIGVRSWQARSLETWIEDEIAPQARELLAGRDSAAAFDLLAEALRRAPEHPTLNELFGEASFVVNISTDPAGASVRVREYDDPNDSWRELGESPVENAPVSQSIQILRIEKEGFVPIEQYFAPMTGGGTFELQSVAVAPEGMVKVAGGNIALWASEPLQIGPFWLDRWEVSNQKYLEFVEAGGYKDARFWTEPFVSQGVPQGVSRGTTLSREEAMSRFVDKTGRPGPATWELGRPPAGEEALPVRGVSWYEAMAYATWADKSLPSFYHWQAANPFSPYDDQLRMSNLEGTDVRPVDSGLAVATSGAHDLAGNVAEWSINSAPGGRYIMGSSFIDPAYAAPNPATREPMSRSVYVGFRCAKFDQPPAPEVVGPLRASRVDFAKQEIVSDEIFAVYRRLFQYDDLPLESELVASDDSSSNWVRQKVEFTAAYRGERIPALVFLPKGVDPPYQTVVYFPSSAARFTPTMDRLADLPINDFIPRSGRALVWPVYQHTFERRLPERPTGESGLRQMWIEMIMDLQRAVDYVTERPDLDHQRLGYMGVSLGAEYAALSLALEPRFTAAVLVAGGFDDSHMLIEPSEINPWHYAPRVTTPTLMINGNLDDLLPPETAQKPLYDLLNVPSDQKNWILLDGGHLPNDQHAITREGLAWFDRFLGPVQ